MDDQFNVGGAPHDALVRTMPGSGTSPWTVVGGSVILHKVHRPRIRHHLDDAMYCRPRGVLGRVGARRMSRENALSEFWATVQLNRVKHRHVLVIGPGPGVGLDLAAAIVRFGTVVALEPSRLMRRMASKRCAHHVASGRLMIRPGTAENTGCDDSSVDAIISVNNVMLWNQTKAFAELHRVLRPDGHLIVAEHQHGHPDRAHFLRRRAEAAGFSLNRLVVENDTTIQLVATRPR